MIDKPVTLKNAKGEDEPWRYRELLYFDWKAEHDVIVGYVSRIDGTYTGSRDCQMYSYAGKYTGPDCQEKFTEKALKAIADAVAIRG